MGPNTCYLLTLCDCSTWQTIRVALKAEEEVPYYNESSGREDLWRQLPPHVRSYGRIVAVEELFEVTVTK